MKTNIKKQGTLQKPLMDTIRESCSKVYNSKLSPKDAVQAIAKYSQQELAEFILEAFEHGWISNWHLGLSEDGEVI